jgi:ABC-2 type transport system permease protein
VERDIVWILFRKEWRQLLFKRSAVVSAVLLPVLMLLVIPGSMAMTARAPVRADKPLPPELHFGLMGDLAADPRKFAGAMLPLMVSMVGLILPLMMASFLLIIEKERRTLELLIALPVRVQHILTAKLLATVTLSSLIAVPLLVIDIVALPLLGAADLSQVVALPLVLVAAIAFSSSGTLLVSLVANDFRSANNFGGALIGPTLLVIVLLTAIVPGGVVRPLVIASLLGLGAVGLQVAARRLVTVERLLS